MESLEAKKLALEIAGRILRHVPEKADDVARFMRMTRAIKRYLMEEPKKKTKK